MDQTDEEFYQNLFRSVITSSKTNNPGNGLKCGSSGD